MATPRQLIDVVYSIVADNNLSRILPVLDEKIMLYVSDNMLVGGEFQGRSGFLTMMSRVYKLWENLSIRSLVYFTPDDQPASTSIITKGLFEGRLLSEKEPVVVPFVHYWEVKDEKIMVFRSFNWEPSRLTHRAQPLEKKSATNLNGQARPPGDPI